MLSVKDPRGEHRGDRVIGVAFRDFTAEASKPVPDFCGRGDCRFPSSRLPFEWHGFDSGLSPHRRCGSRGWLACLALGVQALSNPWPTAGRARRVGAQRVEHCAVLHPSRRSVRPLLHTPWRLCSFDRRRRHGECSRRRTRIPSRGNDTTHIVSTRPVDPLPQGRRSGHSMVQICTDALDATLAPASGFLELPLRLMGLQPSLVDELVEAFPFPVDLIAEQAKLERDVESRCAFLVLDYAYGVNRRQGSFRSVEQHLFLHGRWRGADKACVEKVNAESTTSTSTTSNQTTLPVESLVEMKAKYLEACAGNAWNHRTTKSCALFGCNRGASAAADAHTRCHTGTCRQRGRFSSTPNLLRSRLTYRNLLLGQSRPASTCRSSGRFSTCRFRRAARSPTPERGIDRSSFGSAVICRAVSSRSTRRAWGDRRGPFAPMADRGGASRPVTVSARHRI